MALPTEDTMKLRELHADELDAVAGGAPDGEGGGGVGSSRRSLAAAQVAIAEWHDRQ